MEEGIAAVCKPDEAKALVRVVPLDCGVYRRAGRWRFEPSAAFTWRKSKTVRRRVVVVIKTSPLRPAGISISVHALLDSLVSRRRFGNVAPALIRVNDIAQHVRIGFAPKAYAPSEAVPATLDQQRAGQSPPSEMPPTVPYP
jgi:hypothetical protein